MVVDAWHTYCQRARHLVVDRVHPLRHLLSGYPLLSARADQHGLAAAQAMSLRVRAKIDREVVHADRAYDRPSTPGDQHLTVVRQRTSPAVAVADWEHTKQRLLLGNEAPPVAGALAGSAVLDLRQGGDQLEGRVEPACERVTPGGVHPVYADAAANHVEVRARLAQSSGAVGGVHDDLRI